MTESGEKSLFRDIFALHPHPTYLNRTAFNSFETYRIGTLLFGPSSELANKNASGQLIHDEDVGLLLNGPKKHKINVGQTNWQTIEN